MEKSEIFKRVQLSVSETLGLDKDEITMDSGFIDDLGCDSLGLSELIMIFEDQFDLRVSDIEAEKLRTVGAVVNFISERLKA